jgi:hypothetical protein
LQWARLPPREGGHAYVTPGAVEARLSPTAPGWWTRRLDTTRAYALQQLREAGEFEATARRHARFIRVRLDAAGEAPILRSAPVLGGQSAGGAGLGPGERRRPLRRTFNLPHHFDRRISVLSYQPHARHADFTPRRFGLNRLHERQSV